MGSEPKAADSVWSRVGERDKGQDPSFPVLESHDQIVERLDRLEGPVIAKASDYVDGHVVPPHSHSRAQLIYAHAGVVTVSTELGRWMVPPGHALWVPAGVVHSVTAIGAVRMRSIYVMPGAVADLPEACRAVGLTDLMRSLILEAVKLPLGERLPARAALILALIQEEIPNLPERPLGLPMPATARLATLCRGFVEDPSLGAAIDDWADRAGMSRRSFTRLFRSETGLSLSAWRQQACIFAALPRLAGGEAVTNVALDLGYESAAAFSTMFKRMTGLVPSRYLD
ncbi:AraC-type DNA-binding protein [Roseibium suaedae]|uniref:AraC-type DNA-binding protein n=1 Tax=Roseibium suaedae TaxID=735517 RepID=A0A1M7AZL3_9HYPH|nr:helix-turn-helix transcriptional regulator [Roseibium suaedae]SHL48077.1 AraC-type DNA-binding protein [Roseibium suaedae]